MKKNNINYAFIGNNIAIDFVNTQMIMRGELVDLLEEKTSILDWGREANYLVEDQISEDDFFTVKNLRSALHELLIAKIERNSVSEQAINCVNHHLSLYSPHEFLYIDMSNDEFHITANSDANCLSALMATLAHEGAKLLASKQAVHVKRCSNPNCVLLFLDTSRTRKRRWCSMEICGNRAKVAKHYHKLGQ